MIQERGVAHIVEHLAFNATEQFENHAIIKFLESIGAEFGACSNAYTTCEQRPESCMPLHNQALAASSGLAAMDLYLMLTMCCDLKLAHKPCKVCIDIICTQSLQLCALNNYHVSVRPMSSVTANKARCKRYPRTTQRRLAGQHLRSCC